MHLASQASFLALHSENNGKHTIMQIKHNRLKIPTGWRQTRRLFISVGGT